MGKKQLKTVSGGSVYKINNNTSDVQDKYDIQKLETMNLNNENIDRNITREEGKKALKTFSGGNSCISNENTSYDIKKLATMNFDNANSSNGNNNKSVGNNLM